MAKNKIKRTVMDTYAHEVRPGVWVFTTGTMENGVDEKGIKTIIPRYIFQWEEEVRMGCNLSMAKGDDTEKNWVPILYCKTLEHAVMWAWGYDAGAAANRHPAAK